MVEEASAAPAQLDNVISAWLGWAGLAGLGWAGREKITITAQASPAQLLSGAPNCSQ